MHTIVIKYFRRKLMKTNTCAILFLLIVNFFGFAQVVLPTSWSFATANLPLGWTQSGTGFYNASGNTPPACKFDDTGDNLTIHFANAPGDLTYYLAGNSFANGTFLVEESTDGIGWTTLHSHTAAVTSNYILYTDVPLSTSRYIRFNYFSKVSGNIGLDDVNIDTVSSNNNSFATEPVAQAVNLIFSNIKSYRISAAFTAASPAPDGYIFLRKTGSAITDIPLDGNVYQRGDMIGGSKVVFSGNNLAFIPNGIIANTSYCFAIFAYNGSGTVRNYLTSNPLIGIVTSQGSMQPLTYYSSISTASTTFVTDLHNKINPHTIQSYSNYGAKFISHFIARDTIGGQRAITCVYSGENKIYSEPWDWTTNGFSREHTYCQSWMPTVNNANFQTLPEYSDYHQLFPVNQNNANAVRSNFPLGEVVNIISTYLDSKFGTNRYGQQVYEPRDIQKGDAARALMYQAVCYNGVGGFDWRFPNPISSTIPYGQDQSILKKWHYQDPPDNYEIARNDFIDSLQHNRNPFIDNPLYACYIDFSNMTHIASPDIPCNIVGIAENKMSDNLFTLAPNPSNGNFIVNCTSAKNQNIHIKIVDTMCRIVYSTEQKINTGINSIEMRVQNLNKGIYILELLFENEKQTKKLVID